MMGLGILGGEHRGGQSPMDELRGATAILELICPADPPSLAGGEVRAHGEGEAHRLVADVVSLQGGGHQRPSQQAVCQPSRSIRRRSICSSSKRSSKSMSKISPGASWISVKQVSKSVMVRFV